MTYPDGEVVTYHYNAAGQVESLTSNKQGRQSVIVDRIGYDKEGHTVYTKLGNGTETTYTYDKQRERLQVMNLTADGQTVMENRYRYDAVDNILGITNAADPTSLTKLNRAKLGGRSSHTYEYDELNRLVHASGKAKRASYDMVMSFGRMSEPLTKVQKVDSTTTAKSYNFAYKYEDSNHPTAPTQIGHDHYTYDANGNPTLVTNDSTNTTREMYWDEDNRLMVLSDNGKTSRYTYNAAGERIVKSYGTMEGVYINGAPQGITFHETENFTLYPASILSVNKNRFTKHYFLGDKRVASRIGTGLFNNVYGRNGSYVTAGQQDYAERMNQIQKQKEAYYKQQGIAPGVPTMKGAYGDPENTHIGYNSIIRELGNHDVPQGWVQTPRPNTTPDTNAGPPVSWNDPSNPDDPQAGYGYIANDTTKEETFFYHSDHLGSTSYITDDKANITQYDAYLPYGELLVDEHSSSEDLPYKFNGKQFDDETGLYYYGARYMNPVASIWYGVDPLAEKFVDCSGYEYCLGNPIKLIDENGLYPTSVLKLHKTGWWIFSRSYYTFTPPAAHLLSLVSGINEKHIKGMSIYERSLSHPWPYYDFLDKTDFGGVTLPHGNSFETTYTSNLFDDEKFGQSVMDWLAIASHEVGHIKHIIQSNKLEDQIYLTLLKARENSNGRAIVPSKDEYRLQYYVGMFADSYIKAGSHDGSTLEHEAERGRAIFYDFSKFLSKNKKYGSGFLRNLFHSKRSDSYKIGIIDKIWKEYVEYRKENDKK
ncbi:Cell wall-associated polypeptide CWBP200 [Prevotella denticola]|uniref:Cell wall-associated polypeptide CWBP200 n=2 Tax=Prevotella denticola TaxID=28129 RepID=A0A379EBZ7_9BACT|nr:Cell wall-associated polypeptide CWBP200 [Prevotella denticola]